MQQLHPIRDVMHGSLPKAGPCLQTLRKYVGYPLCHISQVRVIYTRGYHIQKLNSNYCNALCNGVSGVIDFLGQGIM